MNAVANVLPGVPEGRRDTAGRAKLVLPAFVTPFDHVRQSNIAGTAYD